MRSFLLTFGGESLGYGNISGGRILALSSPSFYFVVATWSITLLRIASRRRRRPLSSPAHRYQFESLEERTPLAVFDFSVDNGGFVSAARGDA